MGRVQIVSALVHSFGIVGQLQPIVIDGDQQIIDGHSRMEACRQAGVEPWVVVKPNLPPTARYHSLIRRTPSPQDLADIVELIRSDEAVEGARRAPGTGKLKDVVSKQLADQFGMKVSAREVAYAHALSQASPDERAALDAVEPSSMRAALRNLSEFRLGDEQQTETSTDDRTLLVKRAHEFKAAVLRSNGPVGAADRALLLDLRQEIDSLLARGGDDATA